MHVVVEKSLGSTVAGGGTALRTLPVLPEHRGGELDHDPGWRNVGPDRAAGQRQLFGINAVFSGLTTGSWIVGMCGSSTNAASWNNNEYGYITALVFQ